MPELPTPIASLPGAHWRPLTLDDVAAYTRLLEEARIADGGEEVATEEVTRHELEDPSTPPATNSLVLELPDGSLGGSIILDGAAPGHRRAARSSCGASPTRPCAAAASGRRSCAGASPAAEEILAAQPDDLPGLVEAFKEVRLADAVALHEAHGFRPARWYFDMRRDLREPLPAMPDLGGLEVRPYQPAWAERIRLAHNEAFADHWGSEPQTAEVWSRDFIGDPYFRGDLSFVVVDGDEIAGYTVNYVAEADWQATGVREGLGRPARRAARVAEAGPRDRTPRPLDGGVPGRGPGRRHARRRRREPDGRARHLRAGRLPPDPPQRPPPAPVRARGRQG